MQRLYVDKLSGALKQRPGLEQAKEVLREGDTLVVWRLDRLGRSLKGLVGWVSYLEERWVGQRSLHEAIDTTTRAARLSFISLWAWRSSSATSRASVPVRHSTSGSNTVVTGRTKLPFAT